MLAFASWEDVPLFDSEEAEAGFWSENRPDLRLMEAATAGGIGIVCVYRTNGKLVRVLHARPFEPEERFFYQRKMDQTLNAGDK